MTTTNLYADLGVSPDASAAEIKAAYRRKAKGAHPDAGGSADAFDRIRRAFVVLSDDDRRANYDRTGEADDAVNNDLARVATVLSTKLTEVLTKAKGREGEVDVVEMMRQSIEQEIARMDSLTRQAEKARERMQAAMVRIKFTGKGPNFLRATLEQQLADVEREAHAIAQQSKIHEAALVELGSYGWAFDDPFDGWPEDARPQDARPGTAAHLRQAVEQLARDMNRPARR